MKTSILQSTPRRQAFSLVEVLVAMAVLGVVFGANLSALYFSRTQDARNRELGIMTDFGLHYMEQLRALPFDELVAGGPINALYNGASGAPDVRLPSSTNWVSINGSAYQTFHPDLVWLTNRAPQLQLILVTNSSAGIVRSKYAQVNMRWNPPLGRGTRQTLRWDLLRAKDL